VRSTLTSHPRIIATGLAGLIGFTVFVLLYFEPQALFIDKKVNEALPVAEVPAQPASSAGQAAPPPGPRNLASGDFRSVEHATSGQARVVELADGRRILRFEDFSTSNGPDVRVYLSAAPATSDGDRFDDRYVELGDLKGNVGNQNYTIPPAVNLDRYPTAVVWCKRFSVAFGAAPLTPVS
jgi:Electron transfer DM13